MSKGLHGAVSSTAMPVLLWKELLRTRTRRYPSGAVSHQAKLIALALLRAAVLGPDSSHGVSNQLFSIVSPSWPTRAPSGPDTVAKMSNSAQSRNLELRI